MAGLGAGVIGGATSMFAPPLVIYLVALRLPKETFVGAVSVCLLGGQIPQLVSFVGFQMFTASRLRVAALFCMLSALGFLLGIRLQRTIRQPQYLHCVILAERL